MYDIYNADGDNYSRWHDEGQHRRMQATWRCQDSSSLPPEVSGHYNNNNNNITTTTSTITNQFITYSLSTIGMNLLYSPLLLPLILLIIEQLQECTTTKKLLLLTSSNVESCK